MKGRQENERKTIVLIENLLKDQPNYLKDYYVALNGNGKSYTTQLKYLRYAIYLIEYLQKEYNLSLNTPENFSQVKVSMINAYMLSIKYKEDGTEMSYSLKACRFYGIKNFFDFLVDD